MLRVVASCGVRARGPEGRPTWGRMSCAREERPGRTNRSKAKGVADAIAWTPCVPAVMGDRWVSSVVSGLALGPTRDALPVTGNEAHAPRFQRCALCRFLLSTPVYGFGRAYNLYSNINYYCKNHLTKYNYGILLNFRIYACSSSWCIFIQLWRFLWCAYPILHLSF